MKSRKERAKKYYLLATQYLESAKLLLNTMIENDNQNIGIGFGEKEALEDMAKKIVKSDVYLYTPTMFVSLQTVELFLKGLILLNDKEIEYSHEIDKKLKTLEEIYGRKSILYEAISDFYKNQMDILKKFKKTNNISNIPDLYEALRYPEKNQKVYEYYDLKYKGREVINQYKSMLEKLDTIKDEAIKEFKEGK